MSHGASGRVCVGDDVVDDHGLHERQHRLDELTADRDAERDVRVLLVRRHVADEAAHPPLLLRRLGLVLMRASGPRGGACSTRRARRRGRGARRRSRRGSRASSSTSSTAAAIDSSTSASAVRPGVGDDEALRPAVAGHGLAGQAAPLDQPVDDGGDRGLGDREPLGHERRPLVAAGDQRQHAVLGERQVARSLVRVCGPRAPGRAPPAAGRDRSRQ